MQQMFSLLARSERGQSLVEYALIIALVGIVAFAGLSALGSKSNTTLLMPAAQWAP